MVGEASAPSPLCTSLNNYIMNDVKELISTYLWSCRSPLGDVKDSILAVINTIK